MYLNQNCFEHTYDTPYCRFLGITANGEWHISLFMRLFCSHPPFCRNRVIYVYLYSSRNVFPCGRIKDSAINSFPFRRMRVDVVEVTSNAMDHGARFCSRSTAILVVGVGKEGRSNVGSWGYLNRKLPFVELLREVLVLWRRILSSEPSVTPLCDLINSILLEWWRMTVLVENVTESGKREWSPVRKHQPNEWAGVRRDSRTYFGDQAQARTGTGKI